MREDNLIENSFDNPTKILFKTPIQFFQGTSLTDTRDSKSINETKELQTKM